MTRRRLLAAAFFLAGTLALPASAVRADEILVSAAASLTDAMNEIGAAYTKAHPETTVHFNFGASGALLQQIKQGAPVDVFVSASPKEVDDLAAAGRIDKRANIAGNRLVLIVPSASALHGWGALKDAAVKRIAISDPASVPSGRYAQETLTKRGLWDAVKPKAVFGENVRQTLAYVANGDADAGIVFATDARHDAGHVRVAAEATSGKDHDPIVYPAATVTPSPNPTGARRVLDFLKSRSAGDILKKYGFTPPGKH